MKRVLSLILALTILLAAGAALAEENGLRVLSCPEAGFSTKIPADATWEHDNGDVYVWLEEQGLVPNIWIYPMGKKLDDPIEFMHVTRPERMKEKYGENLMGVSTMEYYEIANLKLTAVSFIYRGGSGNIINQMNLLMTLDNQDVQFQVRYGNDERDMALAALETAIRYFQPDADYYSTPQASSGSTQQTSAGSATGAHSFTVTNVAQDGMIVGRCVAPASYTVTSDAFCCTTAQSAGNPWLLTINAMSEDGIMMIYSSARDYYTRPVDGNTYDEQFNANFMTPMLHYMNAAEFCDYWALKLFQDAKIQLVEENTYPEQQAMLREKEAAEKKMYDSQTDGSGLTISKIEYSLGARRYYVETSGGLQYYLVIATATQGYWNEIFVPGPITNISESYILWGSPYVYVMSCPAYLWDANADVFPVFMENTSVNDQFLLANQKISVDIWSMLTGIDLVGGTEFSRKVMKETTSTGNDYDDERFTDYIYDQNDYTLSDGTHVKISTSYDYVYEGDNGVVYYSDSAFAQPGGSTQLTPNR